jgi:hypothetical protein
MALPETIVVPGSAIALTRQVRALARLERWATCTQQLHPSTLAEGGFHPRIMPVSL